MMNIYKRDSIRSNLPDSRNSQILNRSIDRSQRPSLNQNLHQNMGGNKTRPLYSNAIKKN